MQRDTLELLREKRRAPRPNCRELVVVRVGGLRSFPATCLDRHAGGMRLELPNGQVLQVGEKVEIGSIMSGRVAWIRRTGTKCQAGIAGQEHATEERRQFVRVPVQLTALCEDVPARIKDISLSGLRLEMPHKPRPGTNCQLHIKLPDRPLSLRAEVVATRPTLTSHLVRLRIPSLDGPTAQRLSAYLAGALRN